MDTLFRDAITAAIEDGCNAAWLLDGRLCDVWQRLDTWLGSVPQNFQQDAAAFIVGAFVLTADLIPECGSRGVEMGAGRRIRKASADTDKALKKAARCLRDAVAAIGEARQHGGPLPDAALTTFRFFTQNIPSQHRLRIPSYFWTEPDTMQMLSGMADELDGTKRLNALPEFESQKAGWRDWLRAAVAGINDVFEMYGVAVPLREVDWVSMAKAATSDAPVVTRDSVRAAMRGIRKIRL